MDVHHRISFNADASPDLKTAVDLLNIKYKVSPLPGHRYGLITIAIRESDPKWPELLTLTQDRQLPDFFDTVFSNEEILAAEWCRLIPVNQKGFPHPQATWIAQLHIHFESYCSECGAYTGQRELFRIKQEPKMGKKSFMSFHWTYALFAVPHVLDLFDSNKIQGYEPLDVLIGNSNRVSAIIWQLGIRNISESRLATDTDLNWKQCTQCHTVKYLPHMRGHMKLTAAPSITEGDDIILSKQWFGDGKAAFQEIFVSRRVVSLIIAENWQGVKLKPILIG